MIFETLLETQQVKLRKILKWNKTQKNIQHKNKEFFRIMKRFRCVTEISTFILLVYFSNVPEYLLIKNIVIKAKILYLEFNTENNNRKKEQKRRQELFRMSWKEFGVLNLLWDNFLCKFIKCFWIFVNGKKLLSTLKWFHIKSLTK